MSGENSDREAEQDAKIEKLQEQVDMVIDYVGKLAEKVIDLEAQLKEPRESEDE